MWRVKTLRVTEGLDHRLVPFSTNILRAHQGIQTVTLVTLIITSSRSLPTSSEHIRVYRLLYLLSWRSSPRPVLYQHPPSTSGYTDCYTCCLGHRLVPFSTNILRAHQGIQTVILVALVIASSRSLPTSSEHIRVYKLLYLSPWSSPRPVLYQHPPSTSGYTNCYTCRLDHRLVPFSTNILRAHQGIQTVILVTLIIASSRSLPTSSEHIRVYKLLYLSP